MHVYVYLLFFSSSCFFGNVVKHNRIAKQMVLSRKSLSWISLIGIGQYAQTRCSYNLSATVARQGIRSATISPLESKFHTYKCKWTKKKRENDILTKTYQNKLITRNIELSCYRLKFVHRSWVYFGFFLQSFKWNLVHEIRS